MSNTLITRNLINSYSGNATLTADDIICRYTGSGGHTFTLPNGQLYPGVSLVIEIKNAGSGSLTIAPNNSQGNTIDLSTASLTLAPYDCIKFINQGTTNWMVFTRNSQYITTVANATELDNAIAAAEASSAPDVIIYISASFTVTSVYNITKNYKFVGLNSGTTAVQPTLTKNGITDLFVTTGKFFGFYNLAIVGAHYDTANERTIVQSTDGSNLVFEAVGCSISLGNCTTSLVDKIFAGSLVATLKNCTATITPIAAGNAGWGGLVKIGAQNPANTSNPIAEVELDGCTITGTVFAAGNAGTARITLVSTTVDDNGAGCWFSTDASGSRTNVSVFYNSLSRTSLSLNAGNNKAITFTNISNLITTPVASASQSLLQLGSTAISGGSSNGTYIGVNAASASADFINYQIANQTIFGVSSAGAVTCSQATIGSTVAPLVVTGTLSPDATGTYAYAGQYGSNAYYSKGTSFYIYKVSSLWYISAVLGNIFPNALWFGGTLTGSYSPQNGPTGSATVITGTTNQLVIDGAGNCTTPNNGTFGKVILSQNQSVSTSASLLQLGSSSLVGGNANGTFIGANPASTSADFINYQVNNSTLFKVDKNGVTTFNNQVGTGNIPLIEFQVSGTSQGQFLATNTTGNQKTIGFNFPGAADTNGNNYFQYRWNNSSEKLWLGNNTSSIDYQTPKPYHKFNAYNVGLANPNNVGHFWIGASSSTSTIPKIGVGNSAPIDIFSFSQAPIADATKAMINLTNTTLSGASVSGTFIGANPASASADFINYQVAGVSKFKVDYNGGLTCLSLPLTSTTQPLLQLGNPIVSGVANGTYLGINSPSSFTGNFIDVQANGSSKFTLTNTGNLNVTGIGTFAAVRSLNYAIGGTQISTENTNGFYTGNLNFNPTNSTGACFARVVYTDSVQPSGGMGIYVADQTSACTFAPLEKQFLKMSNAGVCAYSVSTVGKTGVGTALPLDYLSFAVTPSPSATNAMINLTNTTLSGASTNGTYIGGNTSGSADWVNFQVSGVTKHKVDNSGSVYTPSGQFHYFGDPSTNGSFRQGLSGGVLLTQYVSGGIWYNANQILAQ